MAGLSVPGGLGHPERGVAAFRPLRAVRFLLVVAALLVAALTEVWRLSA